MEDQQSTESALGFSLLCLAMLGATAILLFAGSLETFGGRDRFLVGLALTPAFVLAQYMGFSVRVRGEVHAVYPSDAVMPSVLAFASPVSAVIARGVAELVFVIGSRSGTVQKLMFNLLLQALETLLAFRLIAFFVDSGDINGVGDWAVIGASVWLVSQGDFLILSLAIRLVTGRGTLQGLRTNMVFTVVTISLGCLIGAIVQWYWPMLVFVAPVLMGSMVMVKDRGRLMRRNDDLTRLEGFTRHAALLVRTHDFLAESLTDIHDALDPVASFLIRYEPDGTVHERLSAGDTSGIQRAFLPDSLEDDRWRDLVRWDGTARLRKGKVPWARDAVDRFDELLVSSFERGGVVVGTIVLVNRGRLRDPFSREQEELLGAMVTQLALSTEVRGLVADLEHAATHDSLTGLLNRLGLQEAIGGQTGVVAIADIANFKDVNEALGHEAGNTALREIASRLSSVAGPRGHTLARYGGDQVAVFAPLEGTEDLSQVLGGYIKAFSAELTLHDVSFRPMARVGWLPHSGGIQPAEALRRAEIALNVAKHDPPGTIVEYEARLDSKSSQQLRMLNELVQAITREELDVHFQPKLDIRTETVVGFEALVRWPSRDGGTISPAVFVPLAEQQGQGRRLTDFVVKSSLRQAAAWRDEGLDITININVGVRDLLDSTLPNMVGEQLLATGVPPDRVVLEVTESTMMRDVETAVRTLDRLRQLGVGVSVDDFGTGYSSLAYLARLPITELKVDRSFVAKMNESEEDRFIVSTAVTLGRQLGLDVVAEGVEDVGDLSLLKTLGCDQAQGFGIARPMPGDEVTPWCRTTRFGIRRVEVGDDVNEPVVRNMLVERASENVDPVS